MADEKEAPVLVLAPVDESPAVIAMLERLLERAKKGELLGFAFVAEVRGRSLSTGWHAHDAFRLLGAMRWLEWHMVHAINSSPDSPHNT